MTIIHLHDDATSVDHLTNPKEDKTMAITHDNPTSILQTSNPNQSEIAQRAPSVTSVPSVSKNAQAVLEKRILARDKHGKVIETADQMYRRVAHNIALAEATYGGSVEEWEEIFYQLMRSGKFLPNSPALMNAGRALQQLSACYVLPVSDNVGDIFTAVRNQALVHKTAAGTGFSFGRLRPKGDVVKSMGGTAGGPIEFMRVFNSATAVMKSGGNRRGANMAILPIDHPDIEEFIDLKNNLSEMTNFNISVAITERFLQKVEQDHVHELINPRTGQVAKKVSARKLFQKLTQNAWRTGEPGIIFIDRINNSRSNPTPALGEIESTNPCGEQPLLPNESCNLGSINLGRLVIWDGVHRRIDWAELKKITHVAIRALDNMIDINSYPLPEVAEMSLNNRRVGLGVMGWADMLYQLGIPYNSRRAVERAEAVMRFIDREAKNASEELASNRGVFPNWEESIYGPKGQNRPNAHGIRRLRNCAVTTIAPTGTISIIADASAGIEPLFSLAFRRNIMDNSDLLEVNEYFVEAAKRNNFYSDDLLEDIADRGTLAHRQDVPDWAKAIFVTAHDVSPEWHIRMQAAFQKHTDNAVSKTVNFPNDATEEQVREVFLLAYRLGCKGVTIYRDGARSEQPMSTITRRDGQPAQVAGNAPGASVGSSGAPSGNWTTPRTLVSMKQLMQRKERQPTTAKARQSAVLPRPVPEGDIPGWSSHVRTPQGTVHLHVTELDGEPFECFLHGAKAGTDLAALTEALGRLMSLVLRSGLGVRSIIEQLKDIGGSHPLRYGPVKVLSLPDAIAKILELHYFPDVQPIKQLVSDEHGNVSLVGKATLPRSRPGRSAILGDICPNCGNATLVHSEGCKKCHGCGFSEC
ncbi:MAG TPA: vitamin B12-dependent ribonucleotide reductase [Chloroflexia bacterium]|jgi:ribonucleoside-diphosphate reductase alpha chain